MNLKVKHPLLAAPAFIGGLELKNKIIMAPMGSNFAGEDGHTTEQLESYYEERAKGGVGLIILETSAITWPAGASMPYMIGFSKDEFVSDLKVSYPKSSSAWRKNCCSIKPQRENCPRRHYSWKTYSGAINTKI